MLNLYKTLVVFHFNQMFFFHPMLRGWS